MNQATKRRAALLSFAIAGALLTSATSTRAATFAYDPGVPLNLMEAPATAPAPAPPPPPAPAVQDGVTSLKVTVEAVTGNVQVRGDENQPWQAAKAGMIVDQGAE